MKKFFIHSLFPLFLGILCFTVISCKDDDSDSGNKEAEVIVDEESSPAQRFWTVASQLVSPFDVTENYQDKTFEAIIGTPLDGNSTIRVVNTGSLSLAAERFSEMTGAQIDENTSTYTYHDDAVGTLVYNKSADAKSLATVDVDIKQIPGLQRIVYMTEEQMGQNGKFSGSPYYSFGDVIKLKNADNVDEYWVCVRPAIGAAGKEDTHWVTCSNLPKANVKSITMNLTVFGKRSEETFRVPTALGNNKEHMQNLAEMLYALNYPDQWQKNIEDHNGLPIFHDLKKVRVQLFNKFFWKIVNYYWVKKDIYRYLFNYGKGEMKSFIDDQEGLHMVSKGYTGKVGVYQYTYKNGNDKKLNMHDMVANVPKKSGDDLGLMQIDVVSQNDSHWICDDLFGNTKPRFVVRSATGKQLLGSNRSVYDSICGGPHQIENVYVFRKSMGLGCGANVAHTAITEDQMNNVFNNSNAIKADEVALHKIIGANGHFYNNVNTAKEQGGGAVAMVVWLGDTACVESGTEFNGLAVALEGISNLSLTSDEDVDTDCLARALNSGEKRTDLMCGLSDTRIMANGCKCDHEHLPAETCLALKTISEKVRVDRYFSEWFLPSMGQVVMMYRNLGLKYDKSSQKFATGTYDSKIKERNGANGLFDILDSKSIYTTTRMWGYYYLRVCALQSFSSEKEEFFVQNRGVGYTLPFIAFRYGNGATKDFKE